LSTQQEIQRLYQCMIGRFERLHLYRRITLQKAAADVDLHYGQLPILEYVKQNNGCSQSELAEKLCVTPASVALSTKRLEKAGLLKKITDVQNLRRNSLSITQKGIDVSQKCREAFDRLNYKMFSDFSEEEILQMRDYLDRLLKNAAEECDQENSLEAFFLLMKRLNQSCPRCKEENRD